MIWADIIMNRFAYSVRVPAGVTFAYYGNILKYSLVLRLDDIPLLLRWNLIFKHDNAPFHILKMAGDRHMHGLHGGL